MKNDDFELIQQTLDGNEQAFTTLVNKYQKQVHALAWQKIGDYHIAQEIAQDVFMTAYQKLPTFTNYRQFAGWLYVVTNRKCIAWHRKKKLDTQSIDETNPIELEEVYYSGYTEHQREEAAKEKRRTLVKKLLSKLQESERTVITLFYLAEMSCEEISEFLGVSPNTIRSRLHRARNRLRKDEVMIKENLNSFHLPSQFTENIIKDITRIDLVTPSGYKPLVPLALSAVSAIIVILLIGMGAQIIIRFQKPYNLEAQSKPTIEITDIRLIIDTPAIPVVRTQIDGANVPGKSNGAVHESENLLLAAVDEDEDKNSYLKRQWSDVTGPEGGTVSTLFSTNSGNVYASTRNGLYRLTEDGQSWKLANTIEQSFRDALSGKHEFRHVAEWQNILYRAVDTEILASTDRGATWREFCKCRKGDLVGMVITDKIQDGHSDMTFYLAYKKGVFRSDNSGQSWTPLSGGINDAEIRTIANIENTVFVGTYKGLYRLNGDIWEQIFFDQTKKIRNSLPIVTMAVTNNTLYIARANKDLHPNELKYGITMVMDNNSWLSRRMIRQPMTSAGWTWSLFQSNNRGDSWTDITPKERNIEKKARQKPRLSSIFPSKKKDIKMPFMITVNTSISLTASGKQVLVTDDKEHFYTINSGETWKRLENPDDLRNVSAMVILDENTMYRSGANGIHRTIDGGKSWHQFNTGFVNTNVWELIAVNGILYANTETGLVSSTDGGETWTSVPGDTGYLTRIMINNGDLYARDDKIGIPRLLRFSEKANKLVDISEIPNFKRYEPYKALEELREMNISLSRSITSIPHGKGSFYTSMIGNLAINEETYYIEYMHRLFKWKHDESEWSDTGLLDEGNGNNMWYTHNIFETIGFRLALSGKTIYVGKQDGHLMQSLDDGNTWNDLTANLPFKVIHFRAIVLAENFIYAATDKGVIISGNGLNWHTLTDEEGKHLVMNRLAVDSRTVYGESEQRIYQLNSNTGKWQKVTPEISQPITCLAVQGNSIYVGTKGWGVLRYKLDK